MMSNVYCIEMCRTAPGLKTAWWTMVDCIARLLSSQQCRCEPQGLDISSMMQICHTKSRSESRWSRQTVSDIWRYLWLLNTSKTFNLLHPLQRGILSHDYQSKSCCSLPQGVREVVPRSWKLKWLWCLTSAAVSLGMIPSSLVAAGGPIGSFVMLILGTTFWEYWLHSGKLT